MPSSSAHTSIARARFPLLALVFYVAAPAAAGDLLIQNARLIDGTGAAPRRGMSILLRDGRVAEIAPSIAGDGVAVLDIDGATVLPGLIDAHVHLSVVPGTAFRRDSPEVLTALRRTHLRGYLAAGVTTILDTAISPELASEIRSWLAAGEPGPNFYTLGPAIPAPGGYMSDWNPRTTVASPDQLDAAFDLIESVGAIGVKIPIEKGFGPNEVWPIHSPEMRAAITREAAARGLPIYVHASSEDEQRIGLDMGAHTLVHLDFYGQPPSAEFVQRVAREKPYIVTTFSIMDAELTRWHPDRLDDPLVKLSVPQLELATARDPASGRFEAETEVGMTAPSMPQLLRAAAAWWFITEDQYRNGLTSSMHAARTLHGAGVPLVIGSDAGNWEIIPYQFHASSTHREIELLAEAGVPPTDVLAAATRVSARMLGLDKDIGTIEVGKRADLIVVDGDPLADVRALRTIRWTVKDGVARTPQEWMRNQ